MRISSVSVRGLFGVFDHRIPLNLDERITIVHGPNGFGKTVLLRMLYGLFNARYSDLLKIPFHDLVVAFDTGVHLHVSKAPNSGLGLFPDHGRRRGKGKGAPVSLTPITIARSNDRGGSFVIAPITDEDVRFPLRMLEMEVPELERVSPATWRSRDTNEIFTWEEVQERFADSLPVPPVPERAEPEWFSEIKRRLHLRFIDTQRLSITSPVRPSRGYQRRFPMPTVAAYSDDLGRQLQRTLAEYAELAQSLDRTFPARLVAGQIHTPLTQDQLREKLAELDKRRSRLMTAGLLDQKEDLGFQQSLVIDDRTRPVLSVWVKDVEQKLDVFNNISQRLELLTRVISERFRYKDFSISREEGFAFTTRNGDRLNLRSLSSGEQHELVLLYELLFQVQPGTLFLIDEPEISLHVAWQQQFLPDLQEIAKLSAFDVLIATHSPQIINDRWDLTVELQGPNE